MNSAEKEISIERAAAKGGFWLAGFKFTTQAFSWVITIVVARILVPEDYGLMAMASILTGYVEIFSELGLGAAIIQKKNITQEELSSNFWFSMIVGTVFTVVCFGLAYPTAWIFNEPRVIPITQLISVLFMISALMIVPYNILSREMKFKEIGMVQLSAAVVSTFSMLLMAKAGFGVWTLIWGTIILRAVNVILVFWFSRWLPLFHFMFNEVRTYLRFGIQVAGSNSVLYFLNALITFIIGKMLGAEALGYYFFTMRIARIPNDRIIYLINQVSFPVFSKYQDDPGKSHDMYLRITKYVALIVAPLFLAGAFFGEDIIPVLLGEKWISIIFLFKMVCLSQLIVALTTLNSVVNQAQGRPRLVLIVSFIVAVLMPASIYIASRYGFNALAIPWIVVYPAVCIGFTWVTLRKINISLDRYLRSFFTPLSVTLFIMTGVYFLKLLMHNFQSFEWNSQMAFVQELFVITIFYCMYITLFERESLREVRSLWR